MTHDQVEAMTLADRIVIMNGGHIEQVGSPMEVFLEPANTFVASFIGSPPMNLLDGTIEKQDGTVKVRLTGGSGQRFSIPDAFAKNAIEGQTVKLGLRPETCRWKIAMAARFSIAALTLWSRWALKHCCMERRMASHLSPKPKRFMAINALKRRQPAFHRYRPRPRL
ncbi:hypothetical protein F3P66_14635 [Agrobacterium fabrum]|uniref:hypothetical protein n=1 Tax=Agrobacterium fabrum TaxID=1176649 RepID=UPI001AF4AC02|nr:hypothetical protein [Agrobacterium fabrum]QRM60743.1 hypothetical protein F3P66_14635 [Agrobacterium fabrum]